ncbi:Protein lethal(2)essential for life [Blattella germanica]|nr:Protein lethal(2)essential for life [Blattella germanica]
MSLIPLLLTDLLNEARRPASLLDQDFGLGLHYDLHPPLHAGCSRPWRSLTPRQSSVSNIQNSTEGFRVNMDVQQFKPDELNVTVVDNYVVIDGQHEERQDEHGFVSRQFKRRYKLPDEVEPATVISQLSSDGVLTILAQKKGLPSSHANERIIPITQTQAPALKQVDSKGDNMSLVPLLLSDLLDEARRPISLFDQNFGLGMLHDDLLNPSIVAPLRIGYYRPWRNQTPRQSGVSNIQNDKEGFKVNLDVQQFKPEELSVKVVDNYVVIDGKHEEREDEHGFISRQFQRRYKLPDEVEPDAVLSQLSSDGVLTIIAPKKALPPPTANERMVPITQTQIPAVKQVDSKGDHANQETIES